MIKEYRDPRSGEKFTNPLLFVGNKGCRVGMSCLNCPIRAKDKDCLQFIADHQQEAIELMGWELVGEDTPDSSVDHPSHYNVGKIECIDAIAAATAGLEGMEAVCTGNALKYIWRWKHKNGAEDVKKAIWYLGFLLKEIEDEH